MKKLILGLCLMMGCCAVFAQTSYRVSFVNKHKGDEMKLEKLYLFSIEKRAAIDSVEGKNGVFTFKGKAELPQLASICGTPTGFNVISAFVLDEKPIEIVLDKGIEIKGSEVNRRMADMTKTISEQGNRQRALQMEAGKLAEQNGGQLPDSTGKRLDAAWNESIELQFATLKNGIQDNADNLIPVYFLLNYGEVLGVDFVDNFLKDYKYRDSRLLERTLQWVECEKRKVEGVMFTDFTMKDINGKDCKLSDYAGKGKYVLVDFWASWCGPCRMEMPNVKAVYEQYASKGFEIVGVSLDNDAAAWKKAVSDMGMSWPQLSDLQGWQNSAAKLYNFRGIPATLLLDPQGKVIAVNLRGEALKEKLSEIFD